MNGLREQFATRLRDCGLEWHPEKARIVYSTAGAADRRKLTGRSLATFSVHIPPEAYCGSARANLYGLQVRGQP